MSVADRTSVMQAYLAAMEAEGICPLEPIAQRLALGELVRFRAKGDKPGRKNGWAVLFFDGVPAGEFGHFRLGLDVRWKLGGTTRTLTAPERDAISKRVKKHEAEKQHRKDCAAARAVELWMKAGMANPAHPYLKAKALAPFGIKQSERTLLVPMWDKGFRLRNIQRIQVDGSKVFLTGGETAGLFWHHGVLTADYAATPLPLVIAEGFATAAAIHEATGYAVVAAMSGRNIDNVAQEMRHRFPTREIIVAADYDGHLPKNNGVLWAEVSARNIVAKVAYPVDIRRAIPKVRRSIDFADISRIETAAFIEAARTELAFHG